MIADPAATTAWKANPATLARLGIEQPAGGDVWRMWTQQVTQQRASLDLQVSGDGDYTAINWVRKSSGDDWGLGAGYVDIEGAMGMESDAIGAGYGKMLENGWAAGVSLRSVDTSVVEGRDQSHTIIDIGAHTVEQNSGPTGNLRWGFVVRDVTDEIDSAIDIGAAIDMANGWTLAADLLDFDDLNIGASGTPSGMGGWEIGVGLQDGDLTLGGMKEMSGGPGGTWKLGVAWADYDYDDVIMAGGSFAW